MTTIEDVKEQVKKEFKRVLWEVYSYYNGPEDVVLQALFAKEGINVKELFKEACRAWLVEIDNLNKEELDGRGEGDTVGHEGDSRLKEDGERSAEECTNVCGEETGDT